LLVEIIFLWFSFDYNRIIALCLLQVDKELPPPLSECVIIRLIENLSFEDGAPVLQYLCLLTLFGLKEELDSWGNLPFLNLRLLQICIPGTGAVEAWYEFRLALAEDGLIIVLIQS
jgi:hypothetical protein